MLGELCSKGLFRQLLMTAVIIQCGYLKLNGISGRSGIADKWFNWEMSLCVYLSDPAIQETAIFISTPAVQNKYKS